MKKIYKQILALTIACLFTCFSITPISAISEITNGSEESTLPPVESVEPTYPMTITAIAPDGTTLGGLEFSVQNQNGSTVQFVTSNGNYEVADNGYYRTITTDDTGTVKLSGLQAGIYTIAYTNNNASYLLSQNPTIRVDASNSMATLHMEMNTGSVVFTLTGEDGTAIGGSKFIIKNASDQNLSFASSNGVYTPVANGSEALETNSAGKVTISNLQVGAYTLVQTQKPDEYNGDLVSQPFTVELNKETNLTVINTKLYGSVRINVVGSSNEPITGSEYNIVDANNNMMYFTGDAGSYAFSKTDGSNILRPNADGIRITSMLLGDYTLKEVTAPSGYDSAQNVNFTVNKDQETAITMKNAKSVGTLVINVVDETTNGGVNGYTFNLADEGGKVLKFNLNNGNYEYNTNGSTSALTSNESGAITVNYLPTGTYVLTQTVATSGYIIDRAQIRQTISSQQTTTYKAVVSKSNASINVSDENGEPVMGLTIKVLDSSGNAVFEGLTNENGRLLITGITAGEYKYVISQTPSPYLNKEYSQTFKIDDRGNVEGLDTCVLELTKLTVTLEEKLAGAVFQLKDRDGNILTAETNEEGVAEFIGLSDNIYSLTQTVAPEGYQVSTDSHEITIDRKYTENLVVNFSNGEIGEETSEDTESTEDDSLIPTILPTKAPTIEKHSNKGMIIAIIVVVALLFIGATAFAIIKTRNDDKKDKANEQNPAKPANPRPERPVRTRPEPRTPIVTTAPVPPTVEPEVEEMERPDVADFNADPYAQEEEENERLESKLNEVFSERKPVTVAPVVPVAPVEPEKSESQAEEELLDIADEAKPESPVADSLDDVSEENTAQDEDAEEQILKAFNAQYPDRNKKPSKPSDAVDDSPLTDEESAEEQILKAIQRQPVKESNVAEVLKRQEAPELNKKEQQIAEEKNGMESPESSNDDKSLDDNTGNKESDDNTTPAINDNTLDSQSEDTEK